MFRFDEKHYLLKRLLDVGGEGAANLHVYRTARAELVVKVVKTQLERED